MPSDPMCILLDINKPKGRKKEVSAIKESADKQSLRACSEEKKVCKSVSMVARPLYLYRTYDAELNA